MPVRSRPYKLLGTSELAWLRDRAVAACEAWAAAWLDGDWTAQVACLALQPAGAEASPCLGASRCEALASLHLPAGTLRVVQGLMFGTAALTQPSALAAEAALAALRALVDPLLVGGEPLLQHHRPLPEDEARRGSGAVELQINWPGLELRLALNGEAIRRLLADRAQQRAPAQQSLRPLHDLRDLQAGLGRGRLKLRAWAGHAEIDVATLQAITLGDVLLLDQRIDEPLPLSVAGQPSEQRAYLGRRADRRALQLATAAPRDGTPSLTLPQEGFHVESAE